MKKRKFKNKSSCWLTPDLIESSAFLNLSGKAAMLCLIRFHQKAYKKQTDKKKRGSKGVVITNNGQIIFTYGEARELGIKSPDTFKRVIHELVEEKGFIDVAERGNWYEKSLQNLLSASGGNDTEPQTMNVLRSRGFCQREKDSKKQNSLRWNVANRLRWIVAKTKFKKNPGYDGS